MKKRLLTTVLVAALSCTAALGFAACGGNNEDPTPTPHTHTFNEDVWVKTDATQHWHPATCEHTDEKGSPANHVYTDAQDTTCDVCGHVRPVQGDENFSAPVITVTPAEMKVTSGEEINPLFGVSATDEYDADIEVVVSDDDDLDFENPAVGTYTVTYSATNSKGKTGTATRSYTVEAPNPGLVVEVETDLEETLWVASGHEAKKMVFGSEMYYILDDDTVVTTEEGVDSNSKKIPANVVYYEYAVTGVFHNTRDDAITLYMQGSGGAAAVIDESGFVVEGRDGMNGRRVTKDSPVRTSAPSSFAYKGESAPVPAINHAYYLEIPAGGFAIIVNNNGTFGTQGDAHADGRWWITNNLVAQYGYNAKLYFEDKIDEPLTEYTNHSPVLLNVPPLSVTVNDGTTIEELQDRFGENITYTDDKGSATLKDDVKSGLTVELVGEDSVPAYDNTKEGEYVFTLKITDEEGLSTEFERVVLVEPDVPEVPTIEVNGVRYKHATKDILVNPTTVANVDDHYAIIYTSYFTGVYASDSFGPYFIVGSDDKVVESYSPTAQMIYRKGADGEITETSKANTNVLNGVKVPIGGYVVLCIFSNSADDFNTPMRTEVNSEGHMLGAPVTVYNLEGVKTAVTISGGAEDKIFDGVFVVNQNNDPSVTNVAAYIYDSTFTGEVYQADFGTAIVVNSEGKIQRIFDAYQGNYYYDTDHYWVSSGPAGGSRVGFGTDGVPEAYRSASSSNYCSVAQSTLAKDEWVIIFPNNSTLALNPRDFAKDFRADFSKYTVTLNFEIPADPASVQSIKVGTATYMPENVVVNKYNAEPTDGVIIYTYGFEGTVFTDVIPGGIAIVVDKTTNKSVRVYDGPNGKYYDVDNQSGIQNGTCSQANYAGVAVQSLQENEYVIIFPNAIQSWANTNARAYGKDIVLTNISLEAE